MINPKEKIKLKVNENKKFLGRVAIGTDHAGFEMKEKLIPFIKSLGYEVKDFGAYEYDEFDDYPDFIAPVAKTVSENPENIKGIILGGSGQGEAMVANKFPHVRATVFYGNRFFKKDNIIKLSKEHNDANVLSLGARFLSQKEAEKAIIEWLSTSFSGEYKHQRRIKKIDKVAREIRLKSHF